MPKSIFNPSRRGRRYSPAFKARLIEQCSQPGVVLAAVAQENGVSVPTLRRWLEEAGPLDASVIQHRVLLPTCSSLPGHGNPPSSRSIYRPGSVAAPKPAATSASRSGAMPSS